jgi:DNA sulfur modification protein DndB
MSGHSLIHPLITKGDKDFSKEIRLRKKDYIEMKFPTDEGEKYLNQGYEIKSRFKNGKSLLHKEKSIGDSFEDEIWILFKDIGFTELNKGKLRIDVTPHDAKRKKTKQIDVFAKFGKDVFVIECKAKETLGPKPLTKDIAEIKDLKNRIKKAIREYYEQNDLRITFLICTTNIVVSENDEADAKGADIIIWKDDEIRYFTNLSKIIGFSAKYQLFAKLYSGDEIPEFIQSVPAIKGTMGGKSYYNFMIEPEKLLKIAYVHHRSPIKKDEYMDENAYQRMLNKGKLKQIDEFIMKDGFFANNIIVNFTKDVEFEPIPRSGDERMSLGYLKIPHYYASAWIIDGQHRLYGFSNNEKRFSNTVPVLAFERLKEGEQGRLFIEINKNQKSVESNLLWDLYGDIFENSSDTKEMRLCTISTIAKNLNQQKNAFQGKIFIPSINEKSENPLTMSTICEGLKRNNIIGKECLFTDDDSKTVNFATKRIGVFFDMVSESFPDDWNKGEYGFLCSNTGFFVFILILKEIISYLNYKDPRIVKQKGVKNFETECRELIKPVIDYLKNLDDVDRDKLRRGSTNIAQQKETAKLLMKEINKKYPDFAASKLKMEESEIEHDTNLIEETELALRNLIKSKLKEKYGDGWWRQGVPKGVKDDVDRRIQKEIKNAPWKKKDLESNVEIRLDFSNTGHIWEIIKYGDNWSAFESTFFDKEQVKTHLNGFGNYRNPVQHFRDHTDEVTKRIGYDSVLWLRKCLEMD